MYIHYQELIETATMGRCKCGRSCYYECYDSTISSGSENDPVEQLEKYFIGICEQGGRVIDLKDYIKRGVDISHETGRGDDIVRAACSGRIDTTILEFLKSNDIEFGRRLDDSETGLSIFCRHGDCDHDTALRALDLILGRRFGNVQSPSVTKKRCGNTRIARQRIGLLIGCSGLSRMRRAMLNDIDLNDRDDYRPSLFHEICEADPSLDIIKLLVEKYDADLDSTYDGNTVIEILWLNHCDGEVILYAIENSSHETRLSAFVNRFGNGTCIPSKETKYYDLFMIYYDFLYKKETEYAGKFMKHVDINARDSLGDTILHLAADSSNSIIKFLTQHGADLEMTNDQGISAMSMVMSSRVKGDFGFRYHEFWSTKSTIHKWCFSRNIPMSQLGNDQEMLYSMSMVYSTGKMIALHLPSYRTVDIRFWTETGKCSCHLFYPLVEEASEI